MHENEIGTVIVDCAVHLHQALGPGLLESVYEVTLARQLEKRGFSVQRQVPVPIEFEGEKFEEGFRADLVVEGKVIVELKSVEKVNPAHKKQLLTYLRLTGMKLGYLLNFGESLMKEGITRIINGDL
jgi:GxxExxY protein